MLFWFCISNNFMFTRYNCKSLNVMLGDFLVLFNLSEIKKYMYILILICIDDNIYKQKNI